MNYQNTHMVVSTMKPGALKREAAVGATVCPYGKIRTLPDVLARFDSIMIEDEQEEKDVYFQKQNYLKNMVLIEAFFNGFDVYSSQKSEKFQKNIIRMVGEDRKDPLYMVSYFATRVLLFMMLRFSREQIEKHREKTLSPEAERFYQDFDTLVSMHVGDKDHTRPPSTTWQSIWSFLIEKYVREEGSIYFNPLLLSEILWEFFSRAWKNDEEKGFLDEDTFQKIDAFEKRIDFLKPGETEEQSLLISLLADYGLSFQILYAMVGSVAKQLSEQEGFFQLSEEERQKMFRSIKRDLLVDARYWSKQFTNDNANTEHYLHTSMVWFLPDTGIIPPGKLIFDFERKEISLDESTYPETPIKPEMGTIRRGCPAAFVSGPGLGGNFLARQIDIALEIIFEVYLKEKN